MNMDELRRQVTAIEWPAYLRVNGKDVLVESRENLMVPAAGSLICVYQQGAFEVIDCAHVATIRRVRADHSEQTNSM